MPHPRDPDPSPLLAQHPGLGVAPGADRAADDPPRLARARSGTRIDRRGSDEFVPVSWPEALDRLAAELRRVYAEHGPHAVFGGSYGWASAGRFHDAQHQLHRFLNLAGGYVRSVNSYSSGAASVILPHVIGPQGAVAGNNVSWDELVAESALVLAFGGMALKNNDVGGGGTSRAYRPRAARRGAPARRRVPPDRPAARRSAGEDLAAVWHPIRPGTDVALMLGLAHTLVAEGLHDRGISRPLLRRLGEFSSAYLLGRDDGQPKDAAWAAAICGMPADEIIALARRIAGRRTLVTCSMSLQRAEHGEQPVWMAIVLAAMLGQIGLPGGGFAYALGAVSNTGKPPLAVPLPTMPTGRNSIADFIPVARIADMLLHPGEAFDYNGQTPDLSRYPAGLLGRRQPVPPSPGSRPAARRLRPPGHGRSCTSRRGPRPRATPTSCCRRRSRWSARISAPPPAIRCWSRCTGPSRPTARRATTTRSSPGWPSGSASPTRFTEGRSPRQWLEHIYEPTRRALAERGRQRAEFRRVLGARRAGAADRAVGRRHRARLPPRPRRRAAADAERQDRDRLGDDRRLRLCRLPRPPDLAAAGRRR